MLAAVSRNSRRIQLWLLPLLTLLAMVLRVYRLEHQVLWDDEGFSYLRSGQSLHEILGTLPIEQMPLYYVLLKLWRNFIGSSLFALRALSVLVGVLVVPICFRVCSRWFGPRCGLLSASLGAISAPLIYQAQTVRAYALATMLLLLATALADRVLRGHPHLARLGYVAAAVSTILTHRLGGLSLGLCALSMFWVYRLRKAVGWLALQGVVLLTLGLLLLPMLIAGRSQAQLATGASPASLGTFLRLVLGGMVAAPYEPPGMLWAVVALPLAALALLAPIGTRGPSVRHAVVALALPTLANLVLYLMGLLLRVPLYPYYFTLPLPFLYVAAGQGLHWLLGKNHSAGAAVSVLVVALMLWPLATYYQRPAEDLAPLAHEIANRQQPGDVIVLNSAWRALCFAYYDRSGLPQYAEPTSKELKEIMASHRRIWLVVFGNHPTSAIRERLFHSGFPLLHWTAGTTELTLYTSQSTPDDPTRPLPARFGPSIDFLGYDLQCMDLPEGSFLRVVLWWRAVEPVGQRYKVFVHLEDSQGKVWSQHDAEPAQGTRPTADWEVGKEVVDRHVLSLDPLLPSGTYRLVVGLYDPSTGRRVEIGGQPAITTDGALLLQELPLAGAATSGHGTGGAGWPAGFASASAGEGYADDY